MVASQTSGPVVCWWTRKLARFSNWSANTAPSSSSARRLAMLTKCPARCGSQTHPGGGDRLAVARTCNLGQESGLIPGLGTDVPRTALTWMCYGDWAHPLDCGPERLQNLRLFDCCIVRHNHVAAAAHSRSHLEQSGAKFRSIRRPLDTTHSPPFQPRARKNRERSPSAPWPS